MRIDILTIFPRYFDTPLSEGILRIAAENDLLDVVLTDIREFTEDAHRTVDDCPFGGGAGMVMKPEPIYKALANVLNEKTGGRAKTRIVITTPRGKKYCQGIAADLAASERVVLICGHYEGIDERIYELATDEISVGDFVLSGGEPAALVILDSIARLIPGVLGCGESLAEESFTGGVLEYPQYTRPREFNNIAVPDVLLSGNHAKISRWRREQAISLTARKRPDLLTDADLTESEKELADGILKRNLKGRNKK